MESITLRFRSVGLQTPKREIGTRKLRGGFCSYVHTTSTNEQQVTFAKRVGQQQLACKAAIGHQHEKN